MKPAWLDRMAAIALWFLSVIRCRCRDAVALSLEKQSNSSSTNTLLCIVVHSNVLVEELLCFARLCGA